MPLVSRPTVETPLRVVLPKLTEGVALEMLYAVPRVKFEVVPNHTKYEAAVVEVQVKSTDALVVEAALGVAVRPVTWVPVVQAAAAGSATASTAVEANDPNSKPRTSLVINLVRFINPTKIENSAVQALNSLLTLPLAGYRPKVGVFCENRTNGWITACWRR